MPSTSGESAGTRSTSPADTIRSEQAAANERRKAAENLVRVSREYCKTRPPFKAVTKALAALHGHTMSEYTWHALDPSRTPKSASGQSADTLQESIQIQSDWSTSVEKINEGIADVFNRVTQEYAARNLAKEALLKEAEGYARTLGYSQRLSSKDLDLISKASLKVDTLLSSYQQGSGHKPTADQLTAISSTVFDFDYSEGLATLLVATFPDLPAPAGMSHVSFVSE